MLMIVSDPTVRGIKTARRIADLVKELNLDIDKYALIINRFQAERVLELKALPRALG